MVLLPRLPAIFLHAVNQPRFAFTKGGNRTIKGVKTVEVKFQENGRPTILRASHGRDAPSNGSFWIDPATGAVLASFLKNGDSSAVYDELTITLRARCGDEPLAAGVAGGEDVRLGGREGDRREGDVQELAQRPRGR